MLATSRSASRRATLSRVVPLSPAGVLRGLIMSEETGGVHDKGRRAIAKNGRAAEKSLAAVHAVKLLDDDFLLPNKFVDDQRCSAFGELDQDYLAAHGTGRIRKPNALSKPDRRKKIVTNGHDRCSLRLEQHRLRATDSLEHVRERDGVNFIIDLRQKSARYRKRERKTHADARTETSVCMHFE